MDSLAAMFDHRNLPLGSRWHTFAFMMMHSADAGFHNTLFSTIYTCNKLSHTSCWRSSLFSKISCILV